jgi:hypothetical protein
MAFAIIHNGAPEEIFGGQAFVSYQLKVTTEEEAAWSLSPIGSTIAAEISHSPGALAAYSADDRARFCIHSYTHPVPPDGKLLASYALSVEGDSITATGVFIDPPVPPEVSRMQAKQALRAAGKLAAVQTAIEAGSEELQIYWADAPSFHRDHPSLLAMAEALSMTSDEVDALFRAAAAIT